MTTQGGRYDSDRFIQRNSTKQFREKFIILRRFQIFFDVQWEKYDKSMRVNENLHIDFLTLTS